jgi:hypothetical protein
MDQSLCARSKGSSSDRLTAMKFEEKYRQYLKIQTNGSKKDGKLRCAVITPEFKTKKILQLQNTL